MLLTVTAAMTTTAAVGVTRATAATAAAVCIVRATALTIRRTVQRVLRGIIRVKTAAIISVAETAASIAVVAGIAEQ